jgi:hypothetical protein
MDDPTAQPIYVGKMIALNIDLNTGKQITLKDVFTDDVDYLSLLNDYISKMLMKSSATEEDYYGMEFNGLKLTAPFKGLSDNQQFYLFQGGLTLIFDDKTPEFDTGLYATTISINFSEFGDVIALTKRFYNPTTSVYESNAPLVKEFVQSWSNQDINRQKTEMISNINVYRSLRYGSKMPKQAVAKAEALYPLDQEKFNEMKELASASGQESAGYEQNVWANTAGKYTTVTQTISMYYQNKWKTDTENICFDADGKQLALKDLFIEGYDYKKLIMEGLKTALTQMPTPQSITAEELYQGLNFSISNSEITFTSMPIQGDPTSTYPVFFTVSYEAFGCDNLTIFN